MEILSWTELEKFSSFKEDRTNGPTNAQATYRLFGKQEKDVRVTLFRDNHAWCPYCQKVWLWLEEKQIPYRIKKVTMFCYGEKESWYKKIVPSGMLPALQIDQKVITESDEILFALEHEFGFLYKSMEDPQVMPLRNLERLLFRAWCSWLCYPFRSQSDDIGRKQQFIGIMKIVEDCLSKTPGPYFLDQFSVVDTVFTPYVERMNASLFYYKGYSMREENPNFSRWFDAMETRVTYRGTQSDFHTHVHDLPPQMGGCYSNTSNQAKINSKLVDEGPWDGLPDVKYEKSSNESKEEALYRVLKHRENVIKVNPMESEEFDVALRCALTNMMTEKKCKPPTNSHIGLFYLRDRVNVPRDMSIYAAKEFRKALQETALLSGTESAFPIPLNHRRDQDPTNFK